MQADPKGWLLARDPSVIREYIEDIHARGLPVNESALKALKARL